MPPVCEVHVIGLSDPSKYLSNVCLDVLIGFVGIDFIMVSVIVVYSSNGILNYREALLRAGVAEPTGSRVHQAVLFHSSLANVQAVP